MKKTAKLRVSLLQEIDDQMIRFLQCVSGKSSLAKLCLARELRLAAEALEDDDLPVDRESLELFYRFAWN